MRVAQTRPSDGRIARMAAHLSEAPTRLNEQCSPCSVRSIQSAAAAAAAAAAATGAPVASQLTLVLSTASAVTPINGSLLTTLYAATL
jgi:hypothetical protein